MAERLAAGIADVERACAEAGRVARPGGNITGLTFGVGFEILTKRLEILEAIPSLTKAGNALSSGAASCLPLRSRCLLRFDPGHSVAATQ
jgi:hypothetical protein